MAGIFNSPILLPAACQWQRFTEAMYRDGLPKNHSLCYCKSWIWVSRTSEGPLTWESRQDWITCERQPGFLPEPGRPTQVAWIRAGWLVSRAFGPHSNCSEAQARMALRDEAKEMPCLFASTRQSQTKPPTYIQAFSGQNMEAGRGHRPLTVSPGGEF